MFMLDSDADVNLIKEQFVKPSIKINKRKQKTVYKANVTSKV